MDLNNSRTTNHKSFTIRCYGVLIHRDKVLLLEEHYKGRQFTKFPGGGMEFGEGPKDTVKREFDEELNLNIVKLQHLYTTDFCQLSAFDSSVQVMSIYYLVEASNIGELEKCDPRILQLLWVGLESLQSEILTFPIDRKVAHLINRELR